MESWVSKKLDKWDLGSLKKTFENEEIDEVVFKNLTEDFVKQLIPKIGPQVKFLTKWKQECNADNSNYILSDDNWNSQLELSGIVIETDEEFLSFDEPSVSVSESLDFDIIDSANLSPNLSTPIIDLIDALKSSTLGIGVLYYYRSNHSLTEDHRNDLMDVILDSEIHTSPQLVISPARFKELAALIAKTFPTESESTYYVPYRYDSITKNKILPKGKLFARYNNVYRARLLSSGAVVKKTGTKRKREEQVVERVQLAFRGDLFFDLTDDEFNKKDNWLKNNNDPWDKVIKLWFDTSKRRIFNLISDSSITNYIDSYPVLKHVTQGPNLINIDFTTLYPDKTNNLIKGFDLLAKRLIGVCEKKKRKSEGVKELLAKITVLAGCNDSNSAELRKVHILRLIPLLLPLPSPFPSLVANDPPWRLSKNEVQQNFIILVKTDVELHAELNNRREQLKKYGLTEQPIVSIVEDKQIKFCNIHINEKTYMLSSPLAAVDIAFKSFYSFQLNYPKEAEYPWIVLQQKIYGLKGERDGAVVSSITAFFRT